LAVSGNYVYVADIDYGLFIVDVSDPAHAHTVAFTATPGSALGVAEVGNYAYVADNDNGLQIYQFLGGGVAETPNVEVRTTNREPTIIRGVLEMPVTAYRSPHTASLLNLAGRKVLDLKSGANDVSRLAPGVYFISERSAVSGQRSAVRKVVLAK
jgi:hypothetical protein